MLTLIIKDTEKKTEELHENLSGIYGVVVKSDDGREIIGSGTNSLLALGAVIHDLCTLSNAIIESVKPENRETVMKISEALDD
jgi:phosphotransferase system IIB component